MLGGSGGGKGGEDVDGGLGGAEFRAVEDQKVRKGGKTGLFIYEKDMKGG